MSVQSYSDRSCSECGALWSGDATCQDYFYQMLYWENQNPGYGEVHHLAVLCYHLQHPSLYSQEGLAAARQLLVDFIEHDLSPMVVRKRSRAEVASGKRTWNITATARSLGCYERPIQWTMIAGDVIAAGESRYLDSVKAWAQSIYAPLYALH